MYASRAQAGRLVIASDYDFNTGLLTATTDPNNQTTAFTYDLMGRTTQINLPDGGQTSFAYNDVVLPFSVTITTKIDATQNFVNTAVVDGVARLTQTQLTSDPEGTVFVDTTYDALHRLTRKSYSDATPAVSYFNDQST